MQLTYIVIDKTHSAVDLYRAGWSPFLYPLSSARPRIARRFPPRRGLAARFRFEWNGN